MSCGSESEWQQMFVGCFACGAGAVGEPIEVAYADVLPRLESGSEALSFLSSARQPIAADCRVDLGRPTSTPLVPLPAFGENLFAKNETLNPTWGHKDRFHEVAVGAALLLGCRGVVAASTGNHGASAAAHASAAGLPSVIFCHRDASPSALRMITAYGGQPVHLPDEDVHTAVSELVDAGWFPATTMDSLVSGRSNPFGAEGYKMAAYEIVAQLGGCPGTVIVPTAGGDTYYGIAKGFAEASELLGQAPVRVVAAQPAGADPLVRSVDAGRLVRVAEPRSIALSVAMALTGRQALRAVTRWGGATIAVTEEEICLAVVDLAHRGLLVEPASAVALAAYRALRAAEDLVDDRPTVLILTGAGVKWLGALTAIFPGEPLIGVTELQEHLTRIDPRPAARSTSVSAR